MSDFEKYMDQLRKKLKMPKGSSPEAVIAAARESIRPSFKSKVDRNLFIVHRWLEGWPTGNIAYAVRLSSSQVRKVANSERAKRCRPRTMLEWKEGIERYGLPILKPK